MREFSRRRLLSDRAKSVLRGVLFVYAGLVLCPIQYFALTSRTVDDTWLLAMNYAAAHHMVPGRDIVWVSGPLGYLAAPMDMGNNLARGLAFQAALWGLLVAILWDLFFRSGIRLRNLGFFSVFVGLSGPLYYYYPTGYFPNPLGAGDLLFMGALILLVRFRLRGGYGRYLISLVMLGLVPLIKFIGVALVAAVIAGLIVDRVLQKHWREALLAVVLPGLTAGTGLWLTLGSFHTFQLYLKGNLELSRGYNLALAVAGRSIEVVAACEALLLLVAALVLLAIRDRRMARFFALLLAAPVFVSLKHGLVRQDMHVIYVFCFVAAAIGLIALAIALDSERATIALLVILLLLTTLSQDSVVGNDYKSAIAATTGFRRPLLIWHALRPGPLHQMLREEMQRSLSPDRPGLEPEIKALLQHEPVASLSVSYGDLFLDGLNVQLYPVIQRHCAYTPYLDQLNAEWIRDRGSRFLIFDGKALAEDRRHPWIETPAMWVEVYRWYDTRLQGARNLLLERRSQARFNGDFESLAHSQLRFGDPLSMPTSSQPVFWTLRCSLTRMGKLRAVVLRGRQITMTVDDGDQQRGPFRVLPEVLSAPSLGNYLPSDLSEFAQVFSSTGTPIFRVANLSFGGPGARDYRPFCEAELLRPAGPR